MGRKSVIISSVIRQKRESQNGGNKKTKHAKFFEKKKKFLSADTQMYVCVSGGKKILFFWKFGFVSLLLSFWDSLFALLLTI